MAKNTSCLHKWVKTVGASEVLLRCGKCIGCKDYRRQCWMLRLLMEQKDHQFSTFVTLTYDEKHKPKKLDYGELQGFLKRYRGNLKYPIRFFAVGEYGDRTQRPHWHLIMFGSYEIFSEELIDKAWQRGHVRLREASPARMRYVINYMLDSDNVRGMSYRPGLGTKAFESLGRRCANHQRRYGLQFEGPPPSGVVGNRRYPMDKTARLHWKIGFESSGGTFVEENAPRAKRAFLAAAEVRCRDHEADLAASLVQVQDELSRELNSAKSLTLGAMSC